MTRNSIRKALAGWFILSFFVCVLRDDIWAAMFVAINGGMVWEATSPERSGEPREE